MNPWRPLLRSLQDELERLSQEVRGRRVLPNEIDVALPGPQYEAFAPVLEEVTAEIGEKLLEWADQRGRSWFTDTGPFLTLRLDSCPEPRIACDFVQPPSEDESEDAPDPEDGTAEEISEPESPESESPPGDDPSP